MKPTICKICKIYNIIEDQGLNSRELEKLIDKMNNLKLKTLLRESKEFIKETQKEIESKQ